jgi:UDPglucose 6-dehydrogenase
MPEKTKDFNYDFLQRAMQEVNKLVKSEKVVIIMSTCLPTTIRTKIIPYLNPLIKLCYNPVFISAGNILPDFFNPEFTLLGTYDNIATQKVEQFYKTIHNKPIMKMSIESAELSKVAYNTFITMKVCFANMLMEICHKTPNGNVDDVTNFIKAANDRLISPKYLSGGTLDGGPCHNRDRIAMANLEERLNLSTSIYKTLVHTSEAQTKWLASLVSEEQRKSNLLPIMILGTAFKPNIGITTGSGALLLKHYLIYNFDCKDVDHYEPFNKNVNQGQINPLKNKSIFVIGINHDIFKTWKFPDGSIIIDPFRYIPKSDKYKVVYVGINEN